MDWIGGLLKGKKQVRKLGMASIEIWRTIFHLAMFGMGYDDLIQPGYTLEWC